MNRDVLSVFSQIINWFIGVIKLINNLILLKGKIKRPVLEKV